jgi:hypothetical protein
MTVSISTVDVSCGCITAGGGFSVTVSVSSAVDVFCGCIGGDPSGRVVVTESWFMEVAEAMADVVVVVREDVEVSCEKLDAKLAPSGGRAERVLPEEVRLDELRVEDDVALYRELGYEVDLAKEDPPDELRANDELDLIFWLEYEAETESDARERLPTGPWTPLCG